MEWDKIFANYATKKGLISKICKLLMQLNIRETNNNFNQKMSRRSKYTFLQRRHTDLQKCSASLINSVQFSWVAQSCPTLCDPMNCSKPGLPVHHQLPEFTQTHVHRVGDTIQPSHPLSSPFPLAPNPSQHQSFPVSQLFAWGGQSTGVSASASFLPKKSQGWSPSEWTGWISLQSQGTLKSLLQHHSSKASILQLSAFFTVQLSHPYMTTGKT